MDITKLTSPTDEELRAHVAMLRSTWSDTTVTCDQFLRDEIDHILSLDPDNDVVIAECERRLGLLNE